jgi:hypothetical protein
MDIAYPGMPVFVDRYVPRFKPRHPSVQRWYRRVLAHLGEHEDGEPTLFVVGGTVRIHPDNMRALTKMVPGVLIDHDADEGRA